MNKFYVYIYLDIDTVGEYKYTINNKEYIFSNMPRYVGKGYTGKTTSNQNYNRMYNHLYVKDRHTHFYCWLKSLYKKGYNKEDIKPYIIKLIDNLSEEDAFKYEKEFIDVIGRRDKNNGTLLNLCDGGGGSANLSDEIKLKISKANKGRFVGIKNGNYKNRHLYFKENNPFYNQLHTIKTKIKMMDLYITFDIYNKKYYLVRDLHNFIEKFKVSNAYSIVDKNIISKGFKICKIPHNRKFEYEIYFKTDELSIIQYVIKENISSDLLELLQDEDYNLTSIYTGVCEQDDKFLSCINIDNNQKYLGIYYTEDMAGLIYNKYIIDNNIKRNLNTIRLSEEEILKIEDEKEKLYLLNKYGKHYPNINYQNNKWIGRKQVRGNRFCTKGFDNEKDAYEELQRLIL